MSQKREDYISWDEYFMGVAMLSGMRSKDPNTQVGCCIVSQDNKILSMGYNGLPMGCSDDEFFQKRKNRGRITCMAQAYRHYLGDLKRAWLYHGLHHPVLCRRKMERIDERRCHYGNT